VGVGLGTWPGRWWLQRAARRRPEKAAATAAIPARAGSIGRWRGWVCASRGSSGRIIGALRLGHGKDRGGGSVGRPVRRRVGAPCRRSPASGRGGGSAGSEVLGRACSSWEGARPREARPRATRLGARVAVRCGATSPECMRTGPVSSPFSPKN
jgi:hypothetical protein